MTNGLMNMMKSKKNKILGAVFIIGLTLFCLLDSRSAGRAVSTAEERCFNVMIPSLYAMMIMSSLLTDTGIIRLLPRPLKTVGRLIFGMDGAVFPIFAVSMFAGYPVGARLLIGENLTRRDMSIYAGICFGAGPAFISGCISSRLYGGGAAGTVIFISCIAANVILALAVSFFIGSRKASDSGSGRFDFSAETLVNSVSDGGRAMLGICGMVGAFAVFSEFLTQIGAIDLLVEVLPFLRREYIFAALDITAAENFSCGDYTALPVISGLVSFGGVCVLMQICALSQGRLSMWIVAAMRVAAGIMSGIICRLIMPFFISDIYVTASTVRLYSDSSPVPSILLVMMTVFALKSTDFRKMNNLC